MLGGADKPHRTMPDLITIEKLVYGGDGLARVDGRVVLTPFVLPGEQAPSSRKTSCTRDPFRSSSPPRSALNPDAPISGFAAGVIISMPAMSINSNRRSRFFAK